jgi:hypothetical protein
VYKVHFMQLAPQRAKIVTKKAHYLRDLAFMMVMLPSAAVGNTPNNQAKGYWRIKNLNSSLTSESTLFDPQNTETLKFHPLLGLTISIDQGSDIGIPCRENGEIPRDKKTLYRLSLAGKNDFAFKELENALKTCQMGDLRNTSSKFLENLTESSITCSSAPHAERNNIKINDIIELHSVTLLSARYALGSTKNLYLCLEKIPPVVESPKIVSHSLRLKKSIPSPLVTERKMAQNIPEFCPSPSFIGLHPDESPLGVWLGKTRIVYSEAVEAALSTCGIPMGANPQKSIRLMKHYEVLCGHDLKPPEQKNAEIEWIAIAQERFIITSAGGYFYCLEPRASLSH